MSEIQVTSATVKSKAEELKGLNSNFKAAVEQLTTEEQALRSEYVGESSDAFHAAFTKDTTQMQNFYNAIEQYCQKLNEIAAAYEKAEQAATEIATTRKY